MTAELARLRITSEGDVFSVRQRTRDVAEALGFDTTDQVRIAVAISELGRVIIAAGRAAMVTVDLDEGTAAPSLTVNIAADDARLGIDAATVAALSASRRLMDDVVVDDSRTMTVRMSKRLPTGHPPMDTKTQTALRARLGRHVASSPMEELQSQNIELLRTLEELKANQEQLVRLNDELEETNRGVMAMYTQLSDELEETNRGVVALYAELDERGLQLKDASTAKSRFLASVSHELRSPLNSVRSLAGLLREPDSEPLTDEQDNQVRLIGTSADELLVLVNGLLDLAKAESGTLRPELDDVLVGPVFAELRATLRPMTPGGVELVFDVPDESRTVVTDATLLGQLVRNLVSNALKFTEAGEVRVRATLDPAATMTVTVTDTGVGIAPDHQELVFEEFFQVPGRLQSRSKSTGLGLPYARRVAQALGGTLTLQSEPGVGSTFTAILPVGQGRVDVPPVRDDDASLGAFTTVLIADDDPTYREMLRALLDGIAVRIVEAEDGVGAIELMQQLRPDLVLLDVRMPGGGGDVVLSAAAGTAELRNIPIVMVTSVGADDPARQAMSGTRRAVLDKSNLSRPALLAAIRSAASGTDS